MSKTKKNGGSRIKGLYLYYVDEKLCDIVEPKTRRVTVKKQDSTSETFTITYYVSMFSGKLYMPQEDYNRGIGDGKSDISEPIRVISGNLVALPVSFALCVTKKIKELIGWIIENPDKLTHAVTVLMANSTIRMALSQPRLIDNGVESVHTRRREK